MKKNKILIIPLIILSFVMMSMSFVFAQEDSSSELVTPDLPLQAVAGEDKNVVVGRQVLFSANASTGPLGKELNYEWSFGDGRTASGVDVTHVYDTPGIYRVSLQVSYEGALASDEIIVSVDKDISLLITDLSVDEQVRQDLQSKSSTQGVLLVNIHEETEGIDYLVESNLAQQIIDNKDNIRQASNIIVWTDHYIGINALIAASQEFSKASDFDSLGFKNKNIIIVTDKNLGVTSKIAQNLYTLLMPPFILVTSQEAQEYVVENLEIDKITQSLKANELDYQLLGIHSQRPLTNLRPWNFLAFLVNYMVNSGVPLNTIYLILILPIIATVIAFARQLIGVKAFGIYAPSLVAVSFLATGLKYGLLIFAIVLIIGTLSRLAARKVRLSYLPRMAIVLSIVSLSILLFLLFGAFTNQSDLILLSIFPILIMVIITEKFISVQIEQGIKTAFKLIVETLVLSVICYYLANWQLLRSLILGYPEAVFLTFLLNYILGKWTGLRLLEYYRFRNVIKNVELSEKK